MNIFVGWHRHCVFFCEEFLLNLQIIFQLLLYKKSTCNIDVEIYTKSKYIRKAITIIFFIFWRTRVAINEKRLEAEVPIKVVHFSASVDAIFSAWKSTREKMLLPLRHFFRFCSFVVTSFVYRHTAIPRAHYKRTYYYAYLS